MKYILSFVVAIIISVNFLPATSKVAEAQGSCSTGDVKIGSLKGSDRDSFSKDRIVPQSQVSSFSLLSWRNQCAYSAAHVRTFLNNKLSGDEVIQYVYNSDEATYEWWNQSFSKDTQPGQWKWTVELRDSSDRVIASDSAAMLVTDDSKPTNTSTNAPRNNAPTNVDIGGQNYDTSMGEILNPLKWKTIPEAITGIIKLLLLLIASAAVIMIIIGGFRMVLGGGNPGELAKAKSTVVWAIIGLVVALMSFSIVAIVQSLIQN